MADPTAEVVDLSATDVRHDVALAEIDGLLSTFFDVGADKASILRNVIAAAQRGLE